MRFIVIAICSITLFFPTYWLFEAVVGSNWGAGIAAVAMYLAFPIVAIKVWPGRAPESPRSMELALDEGTLASAEFDISEIVEVQEWEDEGRTYLMDIGNNRTLFVSGQYLYGVVDSGRFPSTRIRLFWDEQQNLTFGVQCLGDRLIPSRKIAPLPLEVLESENYPEDRDVIGQRLHDVVEKLSRNA
jgi:hypothetical protein